MSVFFADGDSSDVQNGTVFPVLHITDHTDCIRDDHPPTPRPSRQPDSLPCETTRPQDKAYFLGTNWGTIASFTATTQMRLHLSTTTQSLPERELPFSNDELLCGYEDILSSGTDFTAWVR